MIPVKEQIQHICIAILRIFDDKSLILIHGDMEKGFHTINYNLTIEQAQEVLADSIAVLEKDKTGAVVSPFNVFKKEKK